MRFSHQPGTVPLYVQARRYWRRSVHDSSGHMPRTQPARHEEPYFQLASTGTDFEDALRLAVRANASSMTQLHLTIRKCMDSLRSDGMQCEAALLTMKAYVRELGLRHRQRGSSDMLHSDYLMDQVVRWCISEYYEGSKADS